ncbi:uncharacterized protein J3D65DRAFT_671075 [Phyllosticta citribraziliensis]|uniref:Uncharacterized protein n=1 Tax=Phyllosticta citribraziliensis TaxID=989973 RepID=A0ABR1LD04_9PEZI
MGLELWSYSNDSPRKACATKADPAALSRSPIRRRHAPPVIRRTIDLRRIPPSSFVSPSVRDALAAADATRRSHSVETASPPDSEESDEPPRLEDASVRREPADLHVDRRYLGMDLTSRPSRDSDARDVDGPARSSLQTGGSARATSTSGIGPLRRARPLRDDSLEIARRAVNRRSAYLSGRQRLPRPHSDHTGEEAYRERRAARREAREIAEILERARSSVRPERSTAQVWVPEAADFPPLRRMGRRQVTDGPLPPSGLRQSSLRESWGPGNVDGLGDRERSVSSPPSDHWETMLTTITPDPQLPSAHSSFTSAAASASFSTSNTTSQAGTQSTRSASDGSTPTDLTEPMIQGGWEEQLFCESDEDYDGQVVERFPGFDDLDDDQGSRRRTEQRDRNVWTAAPSPPARNPGRYSSDAHSRLREITNIIQNYNTDRAPSASRSQSPRSRNHVPDVVDGFIDAPANDDRRDSAAVVPNVSRPGSAQNERNERSREATAEQESFDMYIVDPDDPDQRPNRVPTHSLHAPDDQPRGRDYLRAIADHLGLEHGRLAQEDRSADDILDEILDGA